MQHQTTYEEIMLCQEKEGLVQRWADPSFLMEIRCPPEDPKRDTPPEEPKRDRRSPNAALDSRKPGYVALKKATE